MQNIRLSNNDVLYPVRITNLTIPELPFLQSLTLDIATPPIVRALVHASPRLKRLAFGRMELEISTGDALLSITPSSEIVVEQVFITCGDATRYPAVCAYLKYLNVCPVFLVLSVLDCDLDLGFNFVRALEPAACLTSGITTRLELQFYSRYYDDHAHANLHGSQEYDELRDRLSQDYGLAITMSVDSVRVDPCEE